MKAKLYLYAETETDLAQIEDWINCHLQTYVQDFLEQDALGDYDRYIHMKLPDMFYHGIGGELITAELQGD